MDSFDQLSWYIKRIITETSTNSWLPNLKFRVWKLLSFSMQQHMKMQLTAHRSSLSHFHREFKDNAKQLDLVLSLATFKMHVIPRVTDCNEMLPPSLFYFFLNVVAIWAVAVEKCAFTLRNYACIIAYHNKLFICIIWIPLKQERDFSW